jgi:hypothetical protein
MEILTEDNAKELIKSQEKVAEIIKKMEEEIAEIKKVYFENQSCDICKILRYTNPYADSYKCIDCGRIFIISHEGRIIK